MSRPVVFVPGKSVAEHNDVTEGEIRQRQFAAVLRQNLSGRVEVYFTPYVEIFT